jgi:hypothetical protein
VIKRNMICHGNRSILAWITKSLTGQITNMFYSEKCKALCMGSILPRTLQHSDTKSHDFPFCG